jgi:hypothetical protein
MAMIFYPSALPASIAPAFWICPTMDGKPCAGAKCAAWRRVPIPQVNLPNLGYCGNARVPDAINAKGSTEWAEAVEDVRRVALGLLADEFQVGDDEDTTSGNSPPTMQELTDARPDAAVPTLAAALADLGGTPLDVDCTEDDDTTFPSVYRQKILTPVVHGVASLLKIATAADLSTTSARELSVKLDELAATITNVDGTALSSDVRSAIVRIVAEHLTKAGATPTKV